MLQMCRNKGRRNHSAPGSLTMALRAYPIHCRKYVAKNWVGEASCETVRNVVVYPCCVRFGLVDEGEIIGTPAAA